MKKASTYLRPHEHTKRKSISVTQKEVRENEKITELTLKHLIESGINVERPKYRYQCPKERPCVFVSCKYNNYLDVNSSGTIKLNYSEIEPHEMLNSCSLDIADANPAGMRYADIGNKALNLTRERIRQIEAAALKKISSNPEVMAMLGEGPDED